MAKKLNLYITIILAALCLSACALEEEETSENGRGHNSGTHSSHDDDDDNEEDDDDDDGDDDDDDNYSEYEITEGEIGDYFNSVISVMTSTFSDSLFLSEEEIEENGISFALDYGNMAGILFYVISHNMQCDEDTQIDFFDSYFLGTDELIEYGIISEEEKDEYLQHLPEESFEYCFMLNDIQAVLDDLYGEGVFDTDLWYEQMDEIDDGTMTGVFLSDEGYLLYMGGIGEVSHYEYELLDYNIDEGDNTATVFVDRETVEDYSGEVWESCTLEIHIYKDETGIHMSNTVYE